MTPSRTDEKEKEKGKKKYYTRNNGKIGRLQQRSTKNYVKHNKIEFYFSFFGKTTNCLYLFLFRWFFFFCEPFSMTVLLPCVHVSSMIKPKKCLVNCSKTKMLKLNLNGRSADVRFVFFLFVVVVRLHYGMYFFTLLSEMFLVLFNSLVV